MILDREQFSQYWAKSGVTNIVNSPLWIPEERDKVRCSTFVRINQPIEIRMRDYFDWCDTTLKGRTLCFSSGATHEWWGFTEKDDIPIWLLRWSK